MAAGEAVDGGDRTAVAGLDLPPAPPVSLAFQLGWDMSCLYRQARVRRTPKEFKVENADDGSVIYPKLLAQRDFKGSDRTARRLDAVSAGLFRLRAGFAGAGFEPPTVDPVRAVFDSEESRVRLKEEIFNLHKRTLLCLQASDARLGSAFNLGRALAAIRAASSRELSDRFRYLRIRGLRDELEDLVSVLPPHSARAVGLSLGWWQSALEPRLKRGESPRLANRLDRQADLWRALLAGEKAGRDMLSARDNTAAASRMLNGAASIGRQALRDQWQAPAAALAVIVVGLAIGIAIGGVGGTVAAIAALAAGLGVSWKGIGYAVSGLAGRLREPLWSAELDIAIAESITDDEILTSPPNGKRRESV